MTPPTDEAIVERPRQTVADLFHERAAAMPEAIAVVDAAFRPADGGPAECPLPPYGTRRLTYGEVSDRARNVASWLRRSGIGPGSLVAVCGRRSPETLIGLLGVLTAGAAYMPLDPDRPAKELTAAIASGRPRALLAPPALASRIPREVSEGIQLVEPLIDAAADEGDGGEVVLTRPDDLAYVGYPCRCPGAGAVEIEHRSVRNLVTALGTEFGGGPDDVWVSITAPGCGATLPTILLPLVVGARLVLADDEAAASGPALLKLIRGYKVTHVPATPGTWRSLLAAGFDEQEVVALVVGPGLRVDVATEVRRRVRRMSTLYGSLETTVWSLTYPVPTNPDRLPIGRPMVNTRAYVLDERLREVPAGAAGEVYIGGHCVARGYRGRPELTARRFVPDPFDARRGRLFRTGDLGRWCPGGRLEYLGPAHPS